MREYHFKCLNQDGERLKDMQVMVVLRDIDKGLEMYFINVQRLRD